MLLMGKSTVSMAMFNSFLYVYQRVKPFLSVNWYLKFPNFDGINHDQIPYIFESMVQWGKLQWMVYIYIYPNLGHSPKFWIIVLSIL